MVDGLLFAVEAPLFAFGGGQLGAVLRLQRGQLLFVRLTGLLQLPLQLAHTLLTAAAAAAAGTAAAAVRLEGTRGAVSTGTGYTGYGQYTGTDRRQLRRP